MADLNVYLNKLYDSLVHFKLMQCCPVYNNTGNHSFTSVPSGRLPAVFLSEDDGQPSRFGLWCRCPLCPVFLHWKA